MGGDLALGALTDLESVSRAYLLLSADLGAADAQARDALARLSGVVGSITDVAEPSGYFTGLLDAVKAAQDELAAIEEQASLAPVSMAKIEVIHSALRDEASARALALERVSECETTAAAWSSVDSDLSRAYARIAAIEESLDLSVDPADTAPARAVIEFLADITAANERLLSLRRTPPVEIMRGLEGLRTFLAPIAVRFDAAERTPLETPRVRPPRMISTGVVSPAVGQPPETTAAVEAVAADVEADIPGALETDHPDGSGLAPSDATASVPDQSVPAPAEKPAPVPRPEERNFHYDRGQDLAPRGRVSRIRANIAAISLLKTLEGEDRLATPEEKMVLSRYGGWGADKEVFNDQQARVFERAESGPSYARLTFKAAYAWDTEYGEHYREIKALLSEKEWNSAAASTLNAHYTSPEICHGLWDLAVHAGFRGGNVLEPAIGTGQIIGAMPEDLSSRCAVTGVELDLISARLAAKLYPQATVHAEAFQEAVKGDVPDRQYDLVITNVPFSDVAPATQGFPDEPDYNLHNYFIRASMDKLKPGGLGIFITSASTLQNNFKQREALSDRLQLMGAVRLPNNAFAATANTEVVTDLLLVRRPDHLQVAHVPFKSLLPLELPPEGVLTPHAGRPSEDERHRRTNVNEYFAHHPEMVLGYHSLNGRMYGDSRDAGQYTVMPSVLDERPLAERFAEAIARLPAAIPNPSLRASERAARREANLPDPDQNELVRLRARLGTKAGSFELPAEETQDGLKIGVTDRFGFLGPVPWRLAGGEPAPAYRLPRGFDPDRADALALDYVQVRHCLKNVIVTDLNPEATAANSAAVRASLRLAYDGFAAKWGRLNGNQSFKALLGTDMELGSVLALEKVTCHLDPTTGKEVKRIAPATILSARTLYPSAAPRACSSIEDGVNISLAQHGRIDEDYIAGLLGKRADVRGVRALIAGSGLAFENPATGLLESRTQYLSGNVRLKLEQARVARERALNAPGGAEAGVSYLRNVEALEKVIPERALFEQIIVPLNAAWLPPRTVGQFAGTLLNQADGHLQCAFYPHMMQWLVSERYAHTHEVTTQYGTSHLNAVKILEHVLNDRRIKVTYKDDSGAIIYNEAASNQANAVADTIRDAWKEHLKTNQVARDAVLTAYNATFRNVALPEHDGDYLTFPGLSKGPGSLQPRKHQRDVVARMLTEQCGIVAHGVGFGKTFELALAAYESRRTGIARKPMIVCDNASYPQFVATVRDAYPQANLLVADELSLTPRNRQTFLAQMATGDWDIILCSHNHLTAMPSKPQTHVAYHTQALDSLRLTLATMRSDAQFAPMKVRQTQKKIESTEEKLKTKMAQLLANQDESALYFEDTGVDLMLVDEIHKFKRVPFVTNQGPIKGIDTDSSQRALALLLKAQHIQAQRGDGKGVIGATGTPVTNTMAEIWNMGRLTSPQSLEHFGIPNFDMFCSAFAEKVTALELNESNGRWRNETRLARFINGPDFIQFVRSFSDVKMDRDAVHLDVPKLKGGEIELCAVELTDSVADIQDTISGIYDRWADMSPMDKRECSYIPLVLMGTGLAAAIDPRLINPLAPDEPEGLVNTAVRRIAAIYHQTAARRSTQVVFLDSYSPRSTTALDRMGAGGFRNVAREIEDADALPERGADRVRPVESEEREDSPEAEPDFSAEEIPLDPMLTSHFNLYDDIKAKLILLGVKPEEIAIAGEAKSAASRKALFDRVNEGTVRIAIGSTLRLGVGVNVQKKLVALHHLDPARSMTPADMTQRNGRGLRQGNENPEINIIYYGMKDTATPGIYQRLQRKDKFIEQCWAGKGVGVEFEDTGEVRLEDMKSVLISDKRQLARAELLASIKEEKVRRETINNRLRTYTNTIDNNAFWIQQTRGHELPPAQALAEHFRARVAPPLPGERTTLIARAQGQERDLSGTFEEVETRLDDMVKEWKRLRFGDNLVVQELGELVLNGLRLRITRELPLMALSDGAGEHNTNVHLVASARNPLGTAVEYLQESRFASSSALFKIVAARRDDALQQPERIQTRLLTLESDAEKTRALLAAAPRYNEEELTRLNAQLSELESDMHLNPYKRMRRADRDRAQEAALQAEGAPITEAPKIQHPPVSSHAAVFPEAFEAEYEEEVMAVTASV